MSQVEVDKIIPQSGTTLTIGDSGDTITIASGATLSGSLNADNLDSGTVPSARISGGYTGITQTGTLTSFASTGIDDNATSTAITIDSLGLVGIGTTSPNHKLELLGGTPSVSIKSNDTANGTSNILFGDTDDDDIGKIYYQHGTNSLRFLTNASERMRIDSSGNLLVGTTEAPATVATTSSVEGLGYQANDYLAISRAGTSEQGNLILNKLTNDGDIIVFNKNGTRVGSIGVLSSRLYTGTGDTGLFFNDQTDQIQPWNTSTTSARDAAIDLGRTDRRFKDLYLSGGAYLGGTAGANKLDDYEEGTFTPAYSAGGGFSATYAKQIGNYTKIGNKITCWITLFTNTVSLTSGANLTISGLPFASLSGDVQTDYSGTIGRNYRWSSDIDLHATVSQGNSSVTLYYQASNASNLLPAQTSQLTSGSNGYYNNIDITITYETA